ncbi:MAG: STAS/SEC14 domain-containing protein [Aestuariivita sp.]|uniref:STAS/SEC14 domain-containing protein n=1 Tax=Aestuariivita sp. TaxID=1872407 RepID=UPI003BB160CF
MTMTYAEYPEDALVEIRLDGRVTREDYEACIDKMQSFIDTHGTVKMVEIIDSFSGFDPSVIWDGMKFDMRNIKHFSHVAVVSDLGWVSPAAKAAGAFISTKLRMFDLAHLEDARAWLRNPDQD